ncbi:MAG: adenine deaminase C-terminal domain-containing protein [Deltaproteobacteria bacterium]|nr:adenine deaminase C-terminal domain-containing protein [Deltaproteobacteria bacterium]
MKPSSDHADNRQLVETALGNKKADMVIRDGILLDVYSGRLIPHRSVAVKDKWIAYVGPDAAHCVGEETDVIEADGRILSPGYIDAHTHLSYEYDLTDFLIRAIPGGTTTYVTEVESYAFVQGAEGLRVFLEQSRNRPVKIYSLVPPMVTLSPAARSRFITRQEVRELLTSDQVIGLGESYWQGAILTPDNRILGLIDETRRAGKSVQGHAAGASDRKLAAYAAAGALSCHESISTEDVLSRLEMGYFVLIREGYIRRDLDIISPIVNEIDTRRLGLVTDGTSLDLLSEKGYFVDVIQKAVDLGLDFVRVVQMVSLNPAEHLGIDHLTGGISPGRMADILILPGEDRMTPDIVISNGQVVARKGQCTVPLSRVPHPPRFLRTMTMDPVSPEALKIPAENGRGDVSVRTIDIQSNGLVTREGEARITVRGGELQADPENDLLKCVYIERASGTSQKFIGFVRGWGQQEGAAASSLCWDSAGLVAVGTSDEDLTVAINRVIHMQGGTALAKNGENLLDIPCEAGGYVSGLPFDALTEKMNRFQQIVTDLGSTLPSAHLTLCTLTAAAIPFIRMTEQGYARFREGDRVGI